MRNNAVILHVYANTMIMYAKLLILLYYYYYRISNLNFITTTVSSSSQDKQNMNKILLKIGTNLQRAVKPCTQSKVLTSINRSLSDIKEPEDMDQFEKNPFFAKYQDKLKKVYE